MPNYRRSPIPGATYFFTVNLFDRHTDLLVRHIDALRDAVRRTRKQRPFGIDAWVVLPDHIHAVWSLPADDGDFALRWASIKRRYSRAIPPHEPRSPSRITRGERGIWQRRFWEHQIRNAADFRRHVEYCYVNPVKHGLVRRVADWPFSSFHRDVGRGIFPADWAGETELTLAAGERM